MGLVCLVWFGLAYLTLVLVSCWPLVRRRAARDRVLLYAWQAGHSSVGRASDCRILAVIRWSLVRFRVTGVCRPPASASRVAGARQRGGSLRLLTWGGGSSCHRSHFGSRYTLGWCASAGLFDIGPRDLLAFGKAQGCQRQGVALCLASR